MSLRRGRRGKLLDPVRGDPRARTARPAGRVPLRDPQDIEWAISRNLVPGQNIFLLQSRPETVWAGREKAPVAGPKARAFDHVLSLFGGANSGGGTK
ncbi:PEP/pyruvate-binding domain-containing protein [Streptomyces sp. A012304]|uniref:PEP/pyruvate-binding domain-containing protein n=1 Tax=Streptomyces sp. A012304 TaxID=375446 RepID=UPI002801F8BF|nr:hypothetical protein ALMP_57360 [Streptomyces sp. A012304]